MTVEQKDLQSFFFDDYQVILVPASGYEGEMYLIKETAYQNYRTKRVSVEEVEAVLNRENDDLTIAERLNVAYLARNETKVRYFAEYGEAPFNEQVNDILLECEDKQINPPYKSILDWIELTGRDENPAPELLIPGKWDRYKEILSYPTVS